ncbi:MAG: deoxyribose-phosphate aldolase [Bacteroidetes bacterium HGW-Bacteroidetes-17]|jgi:deoxyribose-phosphate aldolase|nr:MAG: deoxyribose-phosphate aldolase [Bacteroidetes bacterium HGW-Bacteroidetes-17]
MNFFNKSYHINEDEIKSRLNKILNQKISSAEKIEIYRQILGMIDLTTLEGSDNNEKITLLCDMAQSFHLAGKNIPDVAAVCVYPPFVALAKSQLSGTNIQVASVAGAFPSGQSPIKVKLAEISYAIEQGADEIDMVISRGKFLEGDYQAVYDEIAAISEVCKDVHLKVILETGELETLKNIRRASVIAISAGADFIKTSTGKIQPAATTEAFLVMLDSIKEHYQNTNKKIGIKPAGGISEPEQAIQYYLLVKDVLGEEWLNPQLLRFGASRLASKILDRIKN